MCAYMYMYVDLLGFDEWYFISTTLDVQVPAFVCMYVSIYIYVCMYVYMYVWKFIGVRSVILH